jgi:sigma-B regulation protein RsbQ
MTETDPLRKNNVTLLGRNDAPRTLVFAHGFGTDQTVWHDMAKPFLADYRVVLFDHVGAGGADSEAYSPIRYDGLDAYVDDLLDIRAVLDSRETLLCGHSLGALVSLKAASRQPESFSGLILIGASPRYLNDGDYHGGFEQAELDAMYEDMQTNYYAWASGFAPLAMRNDDRPELAENFAATLQSLRPDIALAVLRMAMQCDLRKLLTALRLPTLIIQSHHDIAVPMAVGDYLHAHIPGSQLKVVEASGHLPHVSAPGEVIAAIREFLNG